MNTLKKLMTLVTVLLLSMTAIVTTTSAAVITFTQTGSGTGIIGTTNFNNADFTITSIGNTDNRRSFGSGFAIYHRSSTINIDGLGVFSVITRTKTFVSPTIQLVGYGRAGSGGGDLFHGPRNTAFSTWDMLSSIGPIAGSGKLLHWSRTPTISTSGGQLLFNTEPFIPTTFQAAVSPVPEPSTYILLAFGLGVLGIRHRRNLIQQVQ